VVQYTSGLTLYEEALVDTRWISRYWSPIGRLEINPVLKGELIHHTAFGLELDGQSLHRGWALTGYQDAAPEHSGQRHTVVRLQHQVRPVAVRVHTVLDGSPVFSRWLEVENTGTEPAALSSVWVWSGRVFPCTAGDRYYGDRSVFETAYGDYSLGYFVDNKHSSEGHFQWHQLGRETVEIGEDCGKSGWGHPIVYLRDGLAGQVFVAQLAWSGNWRIRVEPKDLVRRDPRESDIVLFARVGPYATAPMRVIEPGETIETPAAHVGFAAGDLTDMVQGLHEHQRRSVFVPPPEGCASLVSYNHWSYMKHELSEQKLLREVDVAASLGTEVFTVDAGWYGREGQPWTITGHWRPGQRLPHGIGPVFDYARSKGLKVGLWVWIEAASQESEVIQAHPDWLLHRDGYALDNQLDLAKPEVAAWVESEIVRIIEEYGLDLFRLDYNASPGEGGYNPRRGYDENTIWRHYEAMYPIWERVRRRYPHLILENCAGGGGRTDLGMASRMHYTWFSDYTLAPRTVRMQNGMMLALAPEVLARPMGVTMNGHLGGDLEMQLWMNMMVGNPCICGVWPTQDDENPVVLERLRRAIAFFKAHVRPMIATCRVYHHTPEIIGQHPQGWCVLEFATPDASKAIVGAFRLAGEGERERAVRFRGLSQAAQYRVWVGSSDEAVTRAGYQLAEQGVLVALPHAMTGTLLSATVVDEAR
jgi:alpha-galactosidase